VCCLLGCERVFPRFASLSLGPWSALVGFSWSPLPAMISWDDDIDVHNVSVMVSVQKKSVDRSASQKKLSLKDSRQPNKRKTKRSSASSAATRSSASIATARSSTSRATTRMVPSVHRSSVPWRVKFPFKMNSDSPIRFGSDCSGWGSEVFALKMLGLNVDHRFA